MKKVKIFFKNDDEAALDRKLFYFKGALWELEHKPFPNELEHTVDYDDAEYLASLVEKYGIQFEDMEEKFNLTERQKELVVMAKKRALDYFNERWRKNERK